MSGIGFIGPLELADVDDRCPLCGLDPQDPTLHAQTCPTVTDDLCGVIHDGRMCMKSEHVPADVRDDAAWNRWREEHDWVPLADATP